MTFPAEETGGKPVIPVTVKVGFHPLLISTSSWLFDAAWIPGTSFKWSSCPNLSCWEASQNSQYLSEGIFLWKNELISPVSKFSSRSRRRLAILKVDGTIPELSPLCTPSFKIVIFRVKLKAPLVDLLSQHFSKSATSESKAKIVSTCPIRYLILSK